MSENLTSEKAERLPEKTALTWEQWQELLSMEEMTAIADSVGLDADSRFISPDQADRFEQICDQARRDKLQLA